MFPLQMYCEQLLTESFGDHLQCFYSLIWEIQVQLMYTHCLCCRVTRLVCVVVVLTAIAFLRAAVTWSSSPLFSGVSAISSLPFFPDICLSSMIAFTDEFMDLGFFLFAALIINIFENR